MAITDRHVVRLNVRIGEMASDMRTCRCIPIDR